MNGCTRPELEEMALRTARALLAPLPDRWRHTVGVARRAGLIAARLRLETSRLEPLDLGRAGELVAGAWLHDIGYARALCDSGFHPLDGARHLAREGWPANVVALVAHHSGARFVAAVRGLENDLEVWPVTEDWPLHVLTYAAQTTGPTGLPMPFEDRLADTLRRRGLASPSALAHARRAPYLRAVRRRVERALLLTEPGPVAG